MATRDDSPMLLCYDGSEDAKHAIERAARLLSGRPAMVMTVWQSTGTLDSFAWSGAMAGMVDFVGHPSPRRRLTSPGTRERSAGGDRFHSGGVHRPPTRNPRLRSLS